MTMVTTTMDQPKLWTKASLNQLTIRNSGLARKDSQPKSTTCSSLGLTRFSRSTSLGPTNRANWLVAPSETAAPANGAGFSSNVVRTVSLKVISCMAVLPSGRKTAAKNVSAIPANEKLPLAVTGPFLAALALCSTSLFCVTSKYRVRWLATALVTVKSPKPPRHSIMCGTAWPSTATSVETCKR